KNLELITVDHSKKTPDNLQEGLNITNVPTFIFYKKGKEIGRFVEYPRETLEKDILAIISGQPYKHSYE
ncbi:MAG: thioredoxin family protein, partial [Flavobacteriaceae bacterium]|nr:thioredoxin family protein [Flavobacteriaceae bacterium]